MLVSRPKLGFLKRIVFPGFDHWPQRHALYERMFRIRHLVPQRLPKFPDARQPRDNWEPHGSIQPQSVQRRKSLSLRAEHVAWQTGGTMECGYEQFFAGLAKTVLTSKFL
jgi:hypothetical protein